MDPSDHRPDATAPPSRNPQNPPAAVGAEVADGDTDAVTQGAVRTLLASQPEPGPMPAHVVARVDAALALAGTRRAANDELFDELGFSDPAAQVPPEEPETIFFDRHTDDYAGEEGDPDGQHDDAPFLRRRWPVLAAAAAAVVVLGGGTILGLVQIRKSADGLAALPGASAPAFAGTTHVQVSNTAYTKATLATGARTLLTSPGPEASSGDAPSVGALATSSGLDSCIAALKQGDATAVSVDLATYEGSPAAVVVARSGDSTQAYAVERDCSTADAGILQDAVPVP